MKRKDDDKVSGEPMFPRLHVNDTGKGGPRAPPRNKMALYEQLSVPAQRFNRGVLPLNPNSNMARPATTGQGSGLERNMFHRHHLSTSTNTRMDEESHARQSNGSNLNAPFVQHEQGDKVGEEDDFQVPVFVLSGKGQDQGETETGGDRETLSPLGLNYPVYSTKFQNTFREDEERVSSQYHNLRQEVIRQSSANLNECMSNMDSSIKSHRRQMNEPSIEHQDHLVGNLGVLQETDASIRHERSSRPETEDTQHGGIEELTRYVQNGNTPRTSKDSHSRGVEPDDGEYPGDRMSGSLLQSDTNTGKSDDASENSMVDSISGMDISPDDVVGIIGQKRFWKARRAIAKELNHSNWGIYARRFLRRWILSLLSYLLTHWVSWHSRAWSTEGDSQQRVFAVQLFELHRLIKVQKLIASAPHLLCEDGTYLGKPSLKGSPIKKLQGYVVRPPSCILKRKHDADKANSEMECSAENAAGRATVSTKNDTQPAGYVGNLPPAAAPLCIPQAGGHQWLVPVMTPSEGLVYKSYPGPGFVGPGYGPIPFSGNFMNPGFGGYQHSQSHEGMAILPCAPQMGHGYFPPYAMPVMNTAVSGAPGGQMNPFAGPVPVPQSQNSDGGCNVNMQPQSSCNVPTVSIPRARKVQVSSIACNQTGEGRDGVKIRSIAPPGVPQAPRVIRVVPHNPRSATESAARIFQSIQKERRKHDSM